MFEIVMIGVACLLAAGCGFGLGIVYSGNRWFIPLNAKMTTALADLDRAQVERRATADEIERIHRLVAAQPDPEIWDSTQNLVAKLGSHVAKGFSKMERHFDECFGSGAEDSPSFHADGYPVPPEAH